MLYSIINGFNGVKKHEQTDIIYLVSSYNNIKQSGNPFVFFDGHGYHSLSECYSDDSGLKEIDWKVIQSKKWFDSENDIDRKRKKQAELLVYQELSINYLLGIGVFNDEIRKNILKKIDENELNLKCKIKRNWYY